MISLIFHAKVKWEEWIDMTDKKFKIYFIIKHLTHFPKEPFSWKTFMACISLGGKKSMQEQKRNFLLSFNSLFGWLKTFPLQAQMDWVKVGCTCLESSKKGNVHKKLKQPASFNHDWSTKSMLMCYHKIDPYQMWGR